ITLQQSSGDFIGRGITAVALDRERRWAFTPAAKAGQDVIGGDILGTVPETKAIEHKIMVPPHTKGKLKWVKEAGEYTVEEVIAELEDGTPIRMFHKSPVKQARP